MNPHSDTLTTADGRTALRMERRLAQPPQRVWAAITQPAHLARWFPSEVSVELRPGGAIGFVFPGSGEPGMTGTVTDAEEPRVFAFTWGEDHLRWEITPEGDGSLLTLVHTFGDRFGAASFASGWHLCITALGQLLDDGKVDVTQDTFGELHETYLAQFDLGRGVVEHTADGRRIRIERQLVRPVETVWAELTSGTEPLKGTPAPKGFTAPRTPPGPVSEVHAPDLLAFTTHSGGEVRWQLTPGTGHGPRLILTESGPGDFDAESALTAWQSRVDALAARLPEK
ncbi:SRPBCC family protein [Streptomyces sp. NBC_01750]|uniref:SRPBCC family protein n=1 Tax=Streptomyces sp. NBC_01750 TaxID=2975928 RepID=UPI002DD9E230|nr:SRPBCC family protein [Streptomyces sp. NBC_01750]WSD35484.1 SRPBCC family protein [Streptomyces sp. NBC_01750]